MLFLQWPPLQNIQTNAWNTEILPHGSNPHQLSSRGRGGGDGGGGGGGDGCVMHMPLHLCLPSPARSLCCGTTRFFTLLFLVSVISPIDHKTAQDIEYRLPIVYVAFDADPIQ